MSVTISTKVPEELRDRILDEMDEGENRSACVRRLIRAGLEADEDAREQRYIAGAPVITVQSLALGAAVGAFGTFDRTVGIIALVVFVGVAVRTAYINHSEDAQ